MANLAKAAVTELRAALAAAEAQPAGEAVAVKWWNGCDKTVPAALRYLADHERPRGGEQRFNSLHLLQLAEEIEDMAKQPLYTAPPAQVPDGWQLVPIDPTQEMILAGEENWGSPDIGSWNTYEQMLAAAPQPDGGQS